MIAARLTPAVLALAGCWLVALGAWYAAAGLLGAAVALLAIRRARHP